MARNGRLSTYINQKVGICVYIYNMYMHYFLKMMRWFHDKSPYPILLDYSFFCNLSSVCCFCMMDWHLTCAILNNINKIPLTRELGPYINGYLIVSVSAKMNLNELKSVCSVDLGFALLEPGHRAMLLRNLHLVWCWRTTTTVAWFCLPSTAFLIRHQL
jgi:hypothetical protein